MRKRLGLLSLMAVLLSVPAGLCVAQRITPQEAAQLKTQALEYMNSLEDVVQAIGQHEISASDRQAYIERYRYLLFHEKASIQSDLDPGNVRIEDYPKHDNVGTYLNNIAFFYPDGVEIAFENLQVSEIQRGPQYTFLDVTFDRVLAGTYHGGQYTNSTIRRKAEFIINERRRTLKIMSIIFAEQEDVLASQAELERQRQAELERQRLATEEEKKRQRLAELERQRLAELARQRQAELERQRLAELERQRQATEEEKKRQRRLKRQRQWEVRRANARLSKKPTITLGYHLLSPNNSHLTDTVAKYWHGFVFGVDLTYVKSSIGAATTIEPWNQTVRLENRTRNAVRVNLWYSDIQFGLPLYLGQRISLYVGSGLFASQIIVLGETQESAVAKFFNPGFLAEASLSILNKSNGRLTFSYRTTLNAKYVDWSGFGLAYQFNTSTSN